VADPAVVDASLVLSRLRGSALPELLALVVDDLLDRPVAGLLDPEFVADQVMAALETAGSGARTEEWLREQLATLRERVPEGTLGDRAPAEVMDPLREALGRPVVWDRELAGRLVDHEAVRSVMSEVLLHALEAYARKLTALGRDNPVSQTARNLGIGKGSLGGGLGRLKTLGEGLARGITAEIEAQTEGRVQSFVDQAMSAVMQQVADHLCDPKYAALYGRYRVHLVDTLLSTELSVLAAELDKMDPDSLVATGAGVARSLSRREGFREEVAQAVAGVLEQAGPQSLRGFLAEAGVDEARWRQGIEEQILVRGRELIEEPPFQEWLARLLAGPDPA